MSSISVYPSCTACLCIFFFKMLSLFIYKNIFFQLASIDCLWHGISISVFFISSSLLSFLQSLSAIPIFVFLCLLCLSFCFFVSVCLFSFVFYIFSSAFCLCIPLSIVLLFYDWLCFMSLQNNGTTVQYSVHVFAAWTPGGN
jgi:hypothetical protein